MVSYLGAILFVVDYGIFGLALPSVEKARTAGREPPYRVSSFPVPQVEELRTTCRESPYHRSSESAPNLHGDWKTKNSISSISF